jgi:acetolactate synthase-1/2/3 large subunit
VSDPARVSVKYADLVAEWLADEGYTHCFFVAGGNIMHLLDGVRSRMTCVPVVHEVAAGIAVEYFNESGGAGKAFALVTAGPGLTNIITAMSGAWLESRELLVLGGQVKSEDLLSGGVRQRGIQEIDGVALSAPVCKIAERVEQPWARSRFLTAVRATRIDRPGPVFLEFCLDAQGAPVDREAMSRIGHDVPATGPGASAIERGQAAVADVVRLTRASKRPIWLIGGGITRDTAHDVHDALVATGVPLMTTWNGADRLSRLDRTYVGRPNTWGQRSANALMNQADLIVVFGSRLGLQQTGFNWQQWAANATVVHIDIDEAELTKGHPKIDVAVHGDANAVLRGVVAESYPDLSEWLDFCHEVRELLPILEPGNVTGEGFLDPYAFYASLAQITTGDDLIVPCSSGGANSTGMQAFEPVAGQVMITDKGLASMGYGLGGAIGAALAWPGRRTVLIEGDGGFTQNLQELATVAVNRLPIKIFIFANNGYGSIRTTQRNYFGGAYLGCDTETGLGFPEWHTLFDAYGIEAVTISDGWLDDAAFREHFAHDRPAAFIVPIDPDQTYWPKITSRVTASGSMESNPLHQMSPDLPDDIAARVFRFVP